MTTARYWTAQAIIDQAAIECGLAAPGTGVYTSTDANVILLRSLLNTAGQGLALAHHWPALISEHTITVANPGDTGTYTLPTDFNGFVDDTGWNRTGDTRLVPVSPQVWQYIKAGGVSSTLSVFFRLDQDSLRVETLPANGTVLAFEYWSRYWARATASAARDQTTCGVYTDVVYYEPTMMVALLCLRFKEVRGHDTSTSLLQFERLFDAASSRTVAARPLDIGGGRGFKFIDTDNAPDTGYGS